MNKAQQAILKFLAGPDAGVDLEKSRNLTNLRAIDPFRLFYRTLDKKIYNGDHEVPIRIYFPSEEAFETADMEDYRKKHSRIDFTAMKDNTYPVLLFIHGGGFVTESVETYNRVCWNLAKHTKHVVVSVDYPLAPEHTFPRQLEDCYAVARAIFTDQSILNVRPEEITVIGDSAGGNLAAAVCLLAKERKEFMPKRQILIYPATNNDYTDRSPFPSVRENGTDFLLTAQKMEDYLNLYQSSPEDRQNPLFAPILARDLTGMPRTLILTAQYDPLRDEGEAFGKRLEEAGNEVMVCRIPDALHGFFALGIKHLYVQKSFEMINQFLKHDTSKEGEEDGRKQNKPVEKTGQCSDHISGYQRET